MSELCATFITILNNIKPSTKHEYLPSIHLSMGLKCSLCVLFPCSEMLGMMKTLDIPVTEKVYASLITGYSRSGLVLSKNKKGIMVVSM